MEGNATREIEDAVQRALGAAGVQGTVTLTGRTLTLRAGGPPVEIDAMYLLEQWPLLPEDLRDRKAADVAARLVEANRAAKAGVVAPSAPAVRYAPSVRPAGAPAGGGGGKPVVVPAGALALVLVLGAAGYWFWSRSQAAPMGGAPTATAAVETEEQQRARLCEVARKTVLETGKLSQLDPQWWMAELWLATPSPGEDVARSKAVADLVDEGKGKLTPNADPDLAALPVAEVEVAGDESAAGGSGGGGALRSLYVRFRGGYVSAFFETAGREKMNRVAGKLADAAGAKMGALYGRCAHLRYHDVGAWFRGESPPHAASALVYAMGFFSERRVTNHDPAAPPTASDLAALAAALQKVDKNVFESAVREAGGTYAPGVGDAPTVITFPLGGPTRATRASGLLADAAGRGVDAPRPGATGSAP